MIHNTIYIMEHVMSYSSKVLSKERKGKEYSQLST